MSKQGLTPKQETFAQQLSKGASQADAYRKAFAPKRCKDKTIHEKASRLAADGKVKARVSELRGPIVAKVRYEIENAMAECDEAIALAKEKGNPGAMVAAVQLKSKLNGLLVEDRANKRRPYEDMEDAQLDRAIQDKAQEAGMSVH